MSFQRHLFVAVAAVASVLVACDESTQPPAEETFEGILRMDEFCVILGGDTSDFMPRPEAFIDTTVVPPIIGPPDNFSLIGACPNPSDGSTSVHFQISEIDSVWIFVYDRPGAVPIDTIFNQGNSSIGSYTVSWQKPGGAGIYRIVMRSATGFQSYGDVEFTDEP